MENYLFMVTSRYFDLNTTYVKGSGDLFKTDKAKLPGKLLGLFNVQCQSQLTFLNKHDTVNSWQCLVLSGNTIASNLSQLTDTNELKSLRNQWNNRQLTQNQ